jgi:hypothetical protein
MFLCQQEAAPQVGKTLRMRHQRCAARMLTRMTTEQRPAKEGWSWWCRVSLDSDRQRATSARQGEQQDPILEVAGVLRPRPWQRIYLGKPKGALATAAGCLITRVSCPGCITPRGDHDGQSTRAFSVPNHGEPFGGWGWCVGIPRLGWREWLRAPGLLAFSGVPWLSRRVTEKALTFEPPDC